MRTILSLFIIVGLCGYYYHVKHDTKPVSKTEITEPTTNTIAEEEFVECYDEEKSDYEKEVETLLNTSDYDYNTRSILEEENFLGSYTVDKITRKSYGTIIRLSTPNVEKLAIRTKDYFIVSYTASFNDNRTIICDNNTKKSVILDYVYVLKLLDKDRIRVKSNYYDTKDVNDPDFTGTITEKSVFNLKFMDYE